MAKVTFQFVKEFSGVQKMDIPDGEISKIPNRLEDMLSEIHGAGIRVTAWDYVLSPEEKVFQDMKNTEIERRMILEYKFTEEFDGDVQWSAGHEDDLWTDKAMIEDEVALRLVTWGYDDDGSEQEIVHYKVLTNPTCRDIMQFASDHVNSDITDHVFLEDWIMHKKHTHRGYIVYDLFFGS